MPGRNGTAAPAEVPGARKRYSAIPKFETFELDVLRAGPDGTLVPTVIEVVGQYSESHEVWIDVQMQTAYQEFEAATFVEETVADPSDPSKMATIRRYRANPEAQARYHRECLMAALKGLEERDADVLCAENGPWKEILEKLGYWHPATEDMPDPEATGEAGPTTAPSSPASPSSTVPTTG
jgi:hypothetical protein